MDKKFDMQHMPELRPFITFRHERWGGIVFNPYLGIEEELDLHEAYIAALCNGRFTVEQIIEAIQKRFGLNVTESRAVFTGLFAQLNRMFAVRRSDNVGAASPRIPDIPVFHESSPILVAPKSVIWDVTYDCNLKCPHCLTDSGGAKRSIMSMEHAFACIDELKKNNVLYLSLSGGEPFLHPYIIELLQYLSQKTNIRVDIATNGISIDEKILKALTELPLFQVQISIDGIGEEHNTFRAHPHAFERATATMHVLRSLGIMVTVSTTVTAQNYKSLDKIIDYAAKNGCSGYKAIPFIPAGRGKMHDDHLRLLPEQYLHVCKRLSAKRKELEGRMNVYAETTFEFLLSPPPSNCQQDGPVRCSAGYDTLSIGADGTVYPCPFLHDFALGNIITDGLHYIWHNTPVLDELRTIMKSDMQEPCRSCEYSPSACNGGCRAAAYLTGESFTAPDPTCYRCAVEQSIC